MLFVLRITFAAYLAVHHGNYLFLEYKEREKESFPSIENEEPVSQFS
jgi:hypothetical protein